MALAGGMPRRKVDGEVRRKVYRVMLDAYKSRSTDGVSVWELDVLAWDRDGAAEAVMRWARSGLVSPGSATKRGTCTHALPCFLDHRERITYPEWSIRGDSLTLRRPRGASSQRRRPMVWLGKGPVVVVGAAGYRRLSRINGTTDDDFTCTWTMGTWE